MIDSRACIGALAEARSPNDNDARVLLRVEQAHKEGDDGATHALARRSWYGRFGYPIDPQKAHDDHHGHCVRANLRKAFSRVLNAARLAEYLARGEIVPAKRKIAKAWMARSSCDKKLIAPPYRRWLSSADPRACHQTHGGTPTFCRGNGRRTGGGTPTRTSGDRTLIHGGTSTQSDCKPLKTNPKKALLRCLTL